MADKKIFANEGPSKPEVPHSSFDLSHCNNLTARAGRIYPVLTYLSPANSSFRIRPHVAFNMHSLAFPIQTNIRCHLSFYKIPLRILWKHFRDFESLIGSDGLPAGSSNQYRIPYINRQSGWHSQGSLADYMGLPSNVVSETISYFNVSRSHILDTNSTASPILIDVEPSPSFNGGYIHLTMPPNDSTSGVRHHAFVQCPSLYLDSNNKTLKVKFFIGITTNIHLFITLYKKVDIPHVPTPSYPISSTYQKISERYNVSPTGNGTVILTLPNGSTVRELSYILPSELVQSYQSAASDSSVTDFGFLFTSNVAEFGSEESDPFLLQRQGTSLTISTDKDPNDETVYLTNSSDPVIGISNTIQYPRKYVLNDNSVQTFSYNPDPLAPNEGKPFIPISALPFRAYEFIYNYFFRNERIIPFTKNNVPTYNDFLTNDGDGADSDTPITFFNAPYEYDLFTTCVKTPQFGNAPLVGISVSGNTGELIMKNLTVENSSGQTEAQYRIGVTLDDDHHIVQVSNYDEVADKPGVHRLQELISSGISINDFRNVNCLQRFLERHQKSGSKYQNVLYEFFGTNPPIGEEFPEYIGGTTVPINVSSVISQAGTEHARLGDYVGLGQFRGTDSDMISCFTSETSYIMGIMYFTITPAYSQMLPAHFAKSRLLDFYNPQFANLGLQPVFKYQLTPLQLSKEEITDVFGYNRPYADYVSCQDEVHGDFRGNLSNYLVQRIFGNAPNLGQDFIEIKSGDVTNVFMDTEDNDKFYGQIYFDMKASLPIPKFSVPRII